MFLFLLHPVKIISPNRASWQTDESYWACESLWSLVPGEYICHFIVHDSYIYVLIRRLNFRLLSQSYLKGKHLGLKDRVSLSHASEREPSPAPTVPVVDIFPGFNSFIVPVVSIWGKDLKVVVKFYRGRLFISNPENGWILNWTVYLLFRPQFAYQADLEAPREPQWVLFSWHWQCLFLPPYERGVH